MSAIVVILGRHTVAAEAPYMPAYVNMSRSYSEMTAELVKEKERCSEPRWSIVEFMPR
jgi:hypothetical protein